MNPLFTPPFTQVKVIAACLVLAAFATYLIYRRIITGRWLA